MISRRAEAAAGTGLDGPYYRHSGRISGPGLILALGLSLPVVILVGGVAGVFKLMGTYFIDLGLLGLAACGGLGGWLVGWAARLGHIRNQAVLRGLAVAAALSLVVMSWALFVDFLQVYELPAGLPIGVWHPWEDWDRSWTIITTYSSDPNRPAQSVLLMWAIAKLTGLIVDVEFRHLTGIPLLLLWSTETLALALAAMLTVMRVAGSQGFVFCETCRRPARTLWRSTLLEPRPAPDSEEFATFRGRLEAGDLAGLATLTPDPGPVRAGSFHRLVLIGCTRCHAFQCVDLRRATVKSRQGEWGVEDDLDEPPISHLLVPPDCAERLRQTYPPAEAT